ncbi:MAG: riboflavin biosynthesis protein RibF [Clostridia bacterium]|nr:riboflavin biosynthesis protein RibF [Clostridia bacterium]
MKRYAVVLGSFDGVHKGHQKVISLAADGNKLIPAAVYFFLPPALHGNKELITNNNERLQLFKNYGVKQTLTLDFEQIKNMSADAFFRFLVDRFNPAVICCGFNYRFGKGAEGDTKTLKQMCEQNGIELRVADPVEIDGTTVSSTVVRSLLKEGNVAKATKLLGRPFSFEGRVQKGDGRGRVLGFPTANVMYPDEKIKVKNGVYVTKITVGKRSYMGVTNIGARPMYPIDNPPSETFIINKKANLYGKKVKIELMDYIREPRIFESAWALSRQISEDANTARAYFEK